MVQGIYDVNFILYHVYENDEDKETANILMDRLKDELQSRHMIKVEIRMEEGGDLIET